MVETQSKVALITGGSSGIGRATAIALSNAGWNVVVTARRADALAETISKCADSNKCLRVEGEITDEAFVQSLFEQTVKRFGRLDMLFNNAGASSPRVPFEEQTLSSFQTTLNVNVVGPFLCTREAFRVFKKQYPSGGRIINNGSAAAHVPRPQHVAYTCSKHAIIGLTKSTALDGREFGITCTQIDIGNARTEMSAQNSAGTLQPNGTLMQEDSFDVKHVADTIVHIAGLPNDVTVLDIKIMAAKAPFVGRG